MINSSICPIKSPLLFILMSMVLIPDQKDLKIQSKLALIWIKCIVLSKNAEPKSTLNGK